MQVKEWKPVRSANAGNDLSKWVIFPIAVRPCYDAPSLSLREGAESSAQCRRDALSSQSWNLLHRITLTPLSECTYIQTRFFRRTKFFDIHRSTCFFAASERWKKSLHASCIRRGRLGSELHLQDHPCVKLGKFWYKNENKSPREKEVSLAENAALTSTFAGLRSR